MASVPQVSPPKPCISLSSPHPIHATCSAHLILLDFITRTILGEQYRSLISSLCSFLHSLVTSSLLGLPLEYLTKKHPVPTKRVTVILINVKSCNTLWHMLLVYIGSYRKSALRYKFLILNVCHLVSQYLCEPGDEDLWSFFENKRGVNEQKCLGKQWCSV